MSASSLPRLSALLITDDTLHLFADLSVSPEEEALIAPVPLWLAQAAYRPDAQTFGLGHDEQPVGLISLIDPRLLPEDEQDHFQPECLYVWRVMIDRDARGHGFGRAAIGFASTYARLIGLQGLSLTTKDAHPGNALAFYQRLGFEPTGRRLDGEIELRLMLGAS